MIDYEAAIDYAVRFFMGERAAKRGVPPHIESGIRKIVDAALGDEPLYRYEDLCGPSCPKDDHLECDFRLVQVWPEVDHD